MKSATFLKLMKSLSKTDPAHALFIIMHDECDTNGDVYLDNVSVSFVKLGFTLSQFSGYVSVLTKKGLYQPHSNDICWGKLLADRKSYTK